MRRFLSFVFAAVLSAAIMPMTNACARTQVDDKSFYPAPDQGHKTYNDHDGHIIYMAYIGRFTSYKDLTDSPFYNLLTQNFPQLAKVSGYTVSTTDQEEDVWMVVPTKESIFACVREYNKDIKDGIADYEDGKVYYREENLTTPILLHTSMQSPGSVIIDVSDSETESMFFAPHYVEPNNELICVSVENDGEDYWPTVPSRLGSLASGEYMSAQEGGFAIRFFLNNRFEIKGADGKSSWGKCFPYMHKGKTIMAVKTDDGKRAVWDYDDTDNTIIRQIKGDVLPVSGKGIVIKAAE